MRNRNTIEFLAVWETLHNPDFNRVQFEAVAVKQMEMLSMVSMDALQQLPGGDS